jgi:hypothetical protein
MDRQHFHLVYATRKLIGLREFRAVESKAMAAQDELRATAKKRLRSAQSGQGELFEPKALDRPYLEELSQRFTSRARSDVMRSLLKCGTMPYDELLARALSHPMTTEKVVKDWISGWRKEFAIAIDGLTAGRRVPELGMMHKVRVTGTIR